MNIDIAPFCEMKSKEEFPGGNVTAQDGRCSRAPRLQPLHAAQDVSKCS